MGEPTKVDAAIDLLPYRAAPASGETRLHEQLQVDDVGDLGRRARTASVQRLPHALGARRAGRDQPGGNGHDRPARAPRLDLLLGLAFASEGVGLLTHRFLLHDKRALPAFVPLLGGKRLPRAAVIVPAGLVSLFVLSIAVAAESPSQQFTDPEAFRRSFPDWMPAWSFWAQQAVLWTWGLSLALAVLIYWRRPRARREARLAS